MIETANIRVTVRTNPLGKRETVNYEWRGKSPYVYISWDMVQDFVFTQTGTQNVEIGPYKLLKVEDAFHLDSILYVRQDKFGALRVALYKSTRLLDLIYRRLIITLAVWHLADFSTATVPTWQDIKILKRFAK